MGLPIFGKFSPHLSLWKHHPNHARRRIAHHPSPPLEAMGDRYCDRISPCNDLTIAAERARTKTNSVIAMAAA